jgi:hypothetical protein
VKTHPASLMIRTWGLAILGFIILPFQLETREIAFYGMMILALFIGTFCAGSVLASAPTPQRPWDDAPAIDFRVTDRVLTIAAVLSIVMLGIEIAQSDVFNLAATYANRSDRGTALLNGEASDSSLFFQIGFLLYPASFVYVVRQIIFERRINLIKFGVIGMMPITMSALTLGGRSSLLFSFILIFLAFRIRKMLMPSTRGPRTQATQSSLLVRLAAIVIVVVGLNYFVTVFIIRAETAGGIAAVFDIAASQWGVSFDGALSRPLAAILGEGNMYLLFVFSWYLVQGIVMASSIFTDYTGPLHFGIYGLDLAAAVMRRIDGSFVGVRFLSLLDLNVYGFFPSAFGSVYVDFGFWGLLPVFLWGTFAGTAYKRVREAADLRWLLIAPFVTAGIVVSLINTPLGFSNGLMAYFWLTVAFLAVRTEGQRRTSGARIFGAAH